MDAGIVMTAAMNAACDIFIVNANDIHQPILCDKGNDGARVVYFSPRLLADAREGAEWCMRVA
jgi:hypothetical protein